MKTEIFDADLFVTFQDHYYNDWGERKDIPARLHEAWLHLGGEKIDLTFRLTPEEKDLIIQNINP